ncbi:MAG TPA: RNA polymerase sigma factor, partial [Terriglobales bacterium]
SAPEPTTDGTPDCVLWVRQALEKLDAQEREILMLREYEQLSYSDIAELLRIPVNTVRSRLFRSRLALKSYLESEAKTNPARRVDAGQPHPGRRGMQ